jgi:hypothetical protein
MGLHCLCAAPHQEIGLTAMQRAYDIIQLFRLRFRHLGMVHNQVRDKLPYAGLGFVANGIEKNALKALIVKSK